ncbi:MAG: hypothetical protein KAH48_02750, partial [Chlorobi bacterium]|nr:hypothetical protein [Chlorobiota bacterium]
MKYLYIFILFLPLNLISNDWVHIDSLEVEGQHGSSKVQNIDCPDSSNCYAFLQETMYYMIKHSSDQGKSWELIYTADPWTEESPIQLNLLNTCSPGKDYLFLNMYESPIIKKSTDGGKTFKRIILDTLNTDDSRILSSLVMYDTNIGFAKNAHYWFVTNDGWETFKKYKNKKYGIYPDSYSSPFFIDSNTIGAWYSSHSYEERAQIFVEYNINKEVWTEKYMIPVDPPDSEYSQYLNDLCFVNDSIGFACGSQTTGVGDTSIDLIFRTTNGGETWERLWKELYDPKFGLNKIAAYDTKNVVAVGNFGKIVMTRDGGENWLIDTLPKLDQHIYRAMAPQITWAGQTPLIGTFYQGGGLYRYEG